MNQSGSNMRKLGILVGGGPAPGINGVIAAATIEARRQGCEVVGIEDGCRWLVQENTEHIRALESRDVEPIWRRGGSFLHTSRENPTKSNDKLNAVVQTLNRLGITHLVTIGGDDTAYTAYRLSCAADTAFRVAHVPKTIDNDLPLPGAMPTFGFETARQVGAATVANLLEDANTTRRWCIAVAMGRWTGHLALGIAAAAGANVALIPEELPKSGCTLELLCELVEGAIFKSHIEGRDYGVAVIAEGVAELVREELKTHPMVVVKYDEFGNWRLSEVPLAVILKRTLQERAKLDGRDTGFVDATIGYELRCADPNAFDIQYTRELGCGAVRYLLSPPDSPAVELGALISIHEAQLKTLSFPEIMDVETGKTKIRYVDRTALTYQSARNRMLRLEPDDMDDPARLAALAAVSKLQPPAFRGRYGRAAECARIPSPDMPPSSMPTAKETP